ncbi:hypothetical protein C5C31_03465 [Rathayibacter rathayi]|uniref:hypothetical protein n=1 Tax=Rathayibacter rathayi TaxID=33887 RepID=UPI000CE93972|nr:hypothetical protein [Rathayibacter rathayi]PPG70827.1 hypothetical protein C5C02_03505 [Rathayibacter rathayi]PPG77929.1 hypothetical protein C5C23_04505 [Rathayibacter rathayi]PPH25649.1 hypothetical protein C5C31_03465 [Rathayibacter rathayi]PPI77109.1 hypothetical protein C5E03_06810 [Rathayibacter rathayi]
MGGGFTDETLPSRLELPAGALLRPLVASAANLLHEAIGEQLDTVTTPDNRPDDPAALAGANIVALVPAVPELTALPEPDAE